MPLDDADAAEEIFKIFLAGGLLYLGRHFATI